MRQLMQTAQRAAAGTVQARQCVKRARWIITCVRCRWIEEAQIEKRRERCDDYDACEESFAHSGYKLTASFFKVCCVHCLHPLCFFHFMFSATVIMTFKMMAINPRPNETQHQVCALLEAAAAPATSPTIFLPLTCEA